MSTIITEEVNIDVAVARSQIDGQLIVEIDTALDEDTEFRIFLNDGIIWSGAPERDNSALHTLEMIDQLMQTLNLALGPDSGLSKDVRGTLNAIDDQLSDHRGHGI